MISKQLSKNKKLITLSIVSLFIAANLCQAKNLIEENNSTEDSITTIEFKEISITISRLIPYEKPVYRVNNDTCFITSDIFESVLGQSIKVNYNNLQNLTMEMSYETSVVITNEGPHCDLRDWKHYLSSWKSIKKIGDHEFVANNYSLKDQKKFPKVNINELKSFVKMSCGEEWFQLLKDINNVNDGASSVGISKVILKIKGTLSGKLVNKILIFYQDLGC